MSNQFNTHMKSVPLEVTMMKRIGELNAERIHDLNQIGGLQEEVANLKADADRFKAQVERLTKTGDAMASSIQFNEEMAQDYNGPAIVHQSVQRWRAAKEGKQSK